MAKKGVNLLEGDDDLAMEGDAAEGFRRGEGRYERRGGIVDGLMVALFVFVMLGGVAWAGYQFWWIPKIEKAERIRQARARREEEARTRLARLRSEAELKKQALMILEQVKREQAQKNADAALNSNSAARTLPAALKPPERRAPLAASPMKKIAALPRAKPRAEIAIVNNDKSAVTRKGARGRPPGAKMKVAEKKRAKRKNSRSADDRGASRSFYYTVQVAACRTDSCVKSFSRRLKDKGFAILKTAKPSLARSGRRTEVRLGSFSRLGEAQALASEAKERKIKARVYKHLNRWRVATGNFRDLEEAAILLDRVEDSGFRGELALRPRTGTTRLYAIRTGKFAGFREASAFRKKVLGAGFAEAVVVRRRLKK